MSKTEIHNVTAYLCGQVGCGADVAAQSADRLARAYKSLTETGSSRDRILQAIIKLADYDAMNGIGMRGSHKDVPLNMPAAKRGWQAMTCW